MAPLREFDLKEVYFRLAVLHVIPEPITDV